ncbi:MAG TPA: hypothetical protein P5099_04855 [Candidatus Moranbacteria bacterium]|nr:hypothetical protein [Candidatus Moranbacteria bacterium]
MHQTFYIDIDEEISSVIDRLDKSITADNYFVVPGRAIFLQSIVNLKLLKREADKLGKKVTIITQDEIGSSMAQKAGIDTHVSLEGLDQDGSDQESNSNTKTSVDEHDGNKDEFSIKPQLEVDSQRYQEQQKRLKGIGSKEFYELSDMHKEDVLSKNEKSPVKRAPVNSLDTIQSTGNSIKEKSAKNIQQAGSYQPSAYRKNSLQTDVQKVYPEMKRDIYQKEYPRFSKMDSRKERTLEKMFSPPASQNDKQPEIEKEIPKKEESRSKKIIFGFFVLCLLAFGGVAVYLLVPNLEIVIIPNILKDKINADVYGSVGIQADVDSNIPIRTIEQTQDISIPYEVTGKSASSGKKAHGSVVIYNEFNSSPQTLVATTRLESPDGKIFRLVKNIVVPGTTSVSGSIQPGAIEAEVVADQPGSDYNIESTKFTIPGFSSSPKFEKFYAKSAASFTGGSLDGDDGTSTVSQKDLDDAKTKTESAINDKVKETINEKLQPGEVSLPEMQKITIEKLAADVKVGDIANTFNYTASVKFLAFVFSQEDVEKIILNKHQKTQDAQEKVSKIEYESINADFDKSTVEMKVFAEIITTPEIDVQKIKKEILGKNMDQLSDILSRYSSIKNADANFWPNFMSRVPQYSQRVNITVDESAK